MYDVLIVNAKIITLDKQGTVESGYIAVKDKRIVEMGRQFSGAKQAKTLIDAQGMVVMPGLVDCHSHLLEYATGEVHHTQGSAQKMAGVANLLTALKAGIVSVGEHHLGHPVLSQPISGYQDLRPGLPIEVKLAFGCCFIGTDPMILTTSTRPGQVIAKEDLNEQEIHEMAQASEFPGENIFLNATVANLPLEAAPKAGEITFNKQELQNIIEIFHGYGKKIGAHIEGDEAAMMFINNGGDVIHHGHGISVELGESMAAQGVALVVTPHAGTSSRPTSPEEVYQFYKQGVKIALASDSYIPVHPEAQWIDLPAGYLVGPEDFLKVVHPILTYLLEQGVPLEEVLKMITVNGQDILTNSGNGNTLKQGNLANIIVCSAIPGIETTDSAAIRYVIKDGEIVVQK